MTQTPGRPVSLAQEQLWLQRKLHPGAALLTMPVVLRLRGPLDHAALADAVRAVVERHDVLSGRIEERDEQIVHVPGAWPGELDVLPLDGLDGSTAADLPDLRLPSGQLLATRLLRRTADDHVLQLQIDHMAFDGASEQVLVNDILAGYEAARAGRPALSGIGPLPASYADFAAWQRQWVTSEDGRAMLDSCREALAGSTDLVLATDHPRQDRMSFRGDSQYFQLGADLATAVREFAVAHRVTPFMTLAAVFGVLMSRRAEPNDDFLIGVPHLGRDSPEWTPLVGLFTNVVPTRIRLPHEETFAGLVRSVRAETTRAVRHSRIPFRSVVDAMRPARQLSRVPLCPVTFQLRYDALPWGRSADFTLQQQPAEAPASEFELTMSIIVDDGHWPGAVKYAADLFAPDTITRITEEFRTLCAELIRHPDRPIGEADHHGPRRAALLDAGNGGPATRTSGVVHAEFSRQAKSTPKATAVVTSRGKLTYAELDTAADGVAARLMAAGVRRGDRVAVAVSRDLAMPTALLGVLKAGAAYLPLDLSLPPYRLTSMLDTGRPTAVVVDHTTRDLLAGQSLPMVDAGGQTPSVPLPQVGPDDLAYVMFTSGTTGEPKAVAVTHGGVTSLTAHPDFLQAGPGVVVSQLAPVVFDPSAIETWVALLTGCTLAVSPTSAPSPAQLHSYVREHGVRVLFLTTGLAQLVIDERPEVFADIDHMITGGDVLSPGHVHRIATAYPNVRLTSFYGATEIAIAATATHNDLMRPGRPIPLGRPMPGREAYVVAEDGQLASPGIPGEIVAGGAGVAHGYLGRPGLTADRFVPHPSLPGARVYRTGDIGSVDSDGVLHFLGRSDRQVKIRGHRVEPAEVDAVLGSHPTVRQSMTRPRLVGNDQILVGYVVTSAPLADADLRAFLGTRLPEYCVPTRFLHLPALPLTSNSKIDTAALDGLPLPVSTPARAGELTALESTVAEIWCAVLELPDLDPDADFFALGGHSLAAARIAARLERVTGRPVPVSVIFTRPTVRTLTTWLADEAPAQAATAAVADTDHQSDDEILAELIGASIDDVARLRDGLPG